MTLLWALTILSVFGVYLNTAITHGSFTITSSKTIRDIYSTNNTILMNEEISDLAVQIAYSGFDPTVKVLDQYFSITMLEVNSKLKPTYAEGEYPRTTTFKVIP